MGMDGTRVWAAVAIMNHKLPNGELGLIPNVDEANSGTSRLDGIYVGDKTSLVMVAWKND